MVLSTKSPVMERLGGGWSVCVCVCVCVCVLVFVSEGVEEKKSLLNSMT